MISKIYNFIINTDQIQKKIIYKLLMIINVIIVLDVFGVALIFPVVNILVGDQLPNGLLEFNFINNLFINNKEFFLISIVLLFLIFYLVKSLILIFMNYLMIKNITLLEVNYSKLLLKTYFSIDTIEFLKKNISELIRNIEKEAGQFVNGLVKVFLTLITEFLMISLLLCILLLVNLKFTLITLIVFGLFGAIYVFALKKKLVRIGRERIELDAKIIKQLLENFSLFKEIKVYVLEQNFINKFEELNLKRLKIITLEGIYNIIPKIFLENIIILIILLFISFYITTGEDINSIIPTASLFSLAMFKILPSINKIILALNNLNFHSGSLDLIFSELKLVKNFINKSDIKVNDVQKLSLENIQFEYENKTIFKNMSLELEKGNLNMIFGEVGSGKSTLLNIVSGFFKPSKGFIKINDQIINDRNELFKNTGFVQQNVVLIDDTIKNNIFYGMQPKEIDDEKYFKIIELLKLSDLENLYKNQTIGDFGNKLSGGQRQKISIARCLVRSKSILIFDESSSSLDTESEKNIFELIKLLSKKYLTIFVTHKKNAQSYADKVFVIDNKKIINAKII